MHRLNFSILVLLQKYPIKVIRFFYRAREIQLIENVRVILKKYHCLIYQTIAVPFIAMKKRKRDHLDWQISCILRENKNKLASGHRQVIEQRKPYAVAKLKLYK